MKPKKAYFILTLFFGVLLYQSCKKDNQSTIHTLFSQGPWEVASIQVFNYVGDTQGPTDTLNKDCNKKQVFTFNTDGSCTYTNFGCVAQTVKGDWSLSNDQLYLISNIEVKDSTDSVAVKPFENTKIVNLGQYSMVLQTGNLESNYGPKQVRRIVQYGFIRQKAAASSN